jgi:hypothetical protein
MQRNARSRSLALIFEAGLSAALSGRIENRIGRRSMSSMGAIPGAIGVENCAEMERVQFALIFGTKLSEGRSICDLRKLLHINLIQEVIAMGVARKQFNAQLTLGIAR